MNTVLSAAVLVRSANQPRPGASDQNGHLYLTIRHRPVRENLSWGVPHDDPPAGFVKPDQDSQSTLDRQDGTTRWTWTINLHEDDSASHDRDPAEVLLDSFENCRFVLAGGHFTGAVGFDLSEDARVATLHDESSNDTSSANSITLSLTWTDIEP